MLKEKGYQEGSLVKSLQELQSLLSQSEQQTQATNIQEEDSFTFTGFAFATFQYFQLNLLTNIFFCIYKFQILYWFLLTDNFFHLQIYELQAILSGDVEINPGPKPNSGQKFSVCHWNLNSIPAHDFSKIPLLIACNSLHTFDIICLSETYLDFSILPQDPNLEMQGYMGQSVQE